MQPNENENFCETTLLAENISLTTGSSFSNKTPWSIVRSLFTLLVPRFHEEVPSEMYRLAGKMRVIIYPLLILTVIPVFPVIEDLGWNRDFMIKMQMVNLPILAIVILLSGIMWRKALSPTSLRRITIWCIFLEVNSFLLNTWSYGSINSQFLFMGICMVLIVRAVYDFRLGLFTLTAILIGLTIIVSLEVSNLIPVQPLISKG